MKKIHPLAAALASVFVVAGCSLTAGVELPRKLEPAADEMVTLVAHARGVQIYECRAKAGTTETEWAFIAPEAELFDLRGHPLGHHGAGPAWQSVDGSAVKGAVKERADAPVAGAIPWLLLKAQPYGAEGRLSKVSSILRVNTEGGLAPAMGCDATRIGEPARVAYKADYLFLVTR